jgi:DNA-binding NtrC family response regulator
VATLDLEGVERLDLHGFLREIEARVVRWALDACGGSQSEAARRLGIPRTTLQARLKRLGITPGEPRDGAPASADRAGGVPRSRQP